MSGIVVSVKEATQAEIRDLSRKLQALLEDKDNQIYQENVAKFGIPEQYVKQVFAEETLLKAVERGKATFFLALVDDEVVGFAQTVEKDATTVELDRIIIFPGHTRKGIGTRILRYVLKDQKEKGITEVIVNTGKEEIQARRFYEKNGFKQAEEKTIEAPWGRKLRLVTYHLPLVSSQITERTGGK